MPAHSATNFKRHMSQNHSAERWTIATLRRDTNASISSAETDYLVCITPFVCCLLPQCPLRPYVRTYTNTEKPQSCIDEHY